MTLNGYDGGDVFAIEPGTSPRRLTSSGDSWLSGRARAELEEVIVNGPAGPIRTVPSSANAAASIDFACSATNRYSATEKNGGSLCGTAG